MPVYITVIGLCASVLPGYLILTLLQLVFTSAHLKKILTYSQKKLQKFYMKSESHPLVKPARANGSVLNVHTEVEDLSAY